MKVGTGKVHDMLFENQMWAGGRRTFQNGLMATKFTRFFKKKFTLVGNINLAKNETQVLSFVLTKEERRKTKKRVRKKITANTLST